MHATASQADALTHPGQVSHDKLLLDESNTVKINQIMINFMKFATKLLNSASCIECELYVIPCFGTLDMEYA